MAWTDNSKALGCSVNRLHNKSALYCGGGHSVDKRKVEKCGNYKVELDSAQPADRLVVTVPSRLIRKRSIEVETWRF